MQIDQFIHAVIYYWFLPTDPTSCPTSSTPVLMSSVVPSVTPNNPGPPTTNDPVTPDDADTTGTPAGVEGTESTSPPEPAAQGNNGLVIGFIIALLVVIIIATVTIVLIVVLMKRKQQKRLAMDQNPSYVEREYSLLYTEL